MATLRISNKTYSYKDFLPFLDGNVKVTIDSNAKKDIKKVKIVVSGAGASALSCAKLYHALGAKVENINMYDSKGLIFQNGAIFLLKAI